MISFSVMICLPHTLQVLTSTYALDPRLDKFKHPPGQPFWASSFLMIFFDLVQTSFGFKVKPPSLIMKVPDALHPFLEVDLILDFSRCVHFFFFPIAPFSARARSRARVESDYPGLSPAVCSSLDHSAQPSRMRFLCVFSSFIFIFSEESFSSF